MHFLGKCRCAAFAAGLLLTCAVSQAQEAFEFFHPLTVRRPVMEQQIEIQGARGTSETTRTSAMEVAVDYRVMSRWQVEPLIPFLWSKGQQSQSESGLGDIQFENKFLLFAPKSRGTAGAGGLDVMFPSESAGRGLGGNIALTPFVTAGTHVRRVELLGDLSCHWVLSGPDSPKKSLAGGLAAGIRVLPWLAPFAEWRGGPVMVAGPGVHIDLGSGRSLLFGVEKSIRQKTDFDTQVRVGLVWDFPSRNK
jgi:hypothetical protein